MGRMTSHILWKKNVPNHQPVFKQCLKPPSKSQDSAPAGRGSSIFGLADGFEVQLMQQPRLLDGRDCIVGHLICDTGEGHVHIVTLLQGFLQKALEFRQSIHLTMAGHGMPWPFHRDWMGTLWNHDAILGGLSSFSSSKLWLFKGCLQPILRHAQSKLMLFAVSKFYPRILPLSSIIYVYQLISTIHALRGSKAPKFFTPPLWTPCRAWQRSRNSGHCKVLLCLRCHRPWLWRDVWRRSDRRDSEISRRSPPNRRAPPWELSLSCPKNPGGLGHLFVAALLKDRENSMAFFRFMGKHIWKPHERCFFWVLGGYTLQGAFATAYATPTQDGFYCEGCLRAYFPV